MHHLDDLYIGFQNLIYLSQLGIGFEKVKQAVNSLAKHRSLCYKDSIDFVPLLQVNFSLNNVGSITIGLM